MGAETLYYITRLYIKNIRYTNTATWLLGAGKIVPGIAVLCNYSQWAYRLIHLQYMLS